MLKIRLRASAAMAALCFATPAYAQPADEAAQNTAAPVEKVVVFGRGETRQQSTITNESIKREAAGTSPLKAIERLPGVSFTSADPLGNYEWSTRITLRGFNQNQLGFTLDGIPLGDMSYGNHNGLHVSRAVISENVDRVVVSQGTGALGDASSSNLGGTVKFFQRAPEEELGVLGGVTIGSENSLRGFAQLNAGALIGDDGPRIAVSYAYQDADKWKGVGEQRQEQINASFVQPIGAGQLSGFVNWSERRENDYQDLSLGMISRLGHGWDNISGDWPLAVLIADIGANRGDTGAVPTNPAAGLVYPAPIQTVDDAYFDASGLRDDTLSSLRFDYPLGENFRISAAGYSHQNEGQGLWWTPYVATPAGALLPSGAVIADPAPISVRTTEYDIDRNGFLGSATLELGSHTIEGGVWFEDNEFGQARRFYGLSRAAQGRDSLEFQNNPFFTQWQYAFQTDTLMFYLQDVWSVTDALTVSAGFKSLTVENSVTTIVPAATGALTGSIEAEEGFLPQVGFTFDVNDDHQLFGTFAENMRAFVSAATAGPFSTTAAGLAAIVDTLEPETSRTFELGWRFRFGEFQGSAAVYHVRFDDRLLARPSGPGIVGNPSILQNVGSVEAQGFELAALWAFRENWSAFASYSYNDSKYLDDVLDSLGAVIAATKDKTTVDSPENLFRGEVTYDDGAFFATAAAAYTGERFFNFVNDRSVDAFTLVELTGGYRIQSGFLEGTEIQANVTNLFDEEYVSTIGSNGFGNSGDNQTLLAGAPRQVFLTIRSRF